MDWLDFEDEFHKDFLPLNSEAMAVNILETTAYFQGKRMVDNYLDQFQDLVYDSRHSGQIPPRPRLADICCFCVNGNWPTLGYGPGGLVYPCHPDGSEPSGRQSISSLLPSSSSANHINPVFNVDFHQTRSRSPASKVCTLPPFTR